MLFPMLPFLPILQMPLWISPAFLAPTPQLLAFAEITHTALCAPLCPLLPHLTEAAVDLARLSGSSPAGVLCEIVNRTDGSMARTPQLLAFAKEHDLKCITIADMIRYRLRHEQLLQEVATAQLDTRYGTFNAHCFRWVCGRGSL